MGERLYVGRTPRGWEVLNSRNADYSTPDDWEIEFAEVPLSETPANGVAMVRSEGFEPPTPGSEDQCSIR